MTLPQNPAFGWCQGTARMKRHVNRMRYYLTNENETVFGALEEAVQALLQALTGMGRHIDGLSGLQYGQRRKPSLRRPSNPPSMSAKGMGHSKILGARAPVTTMVGVVALMWALCWVGKATSEHSVTVDNHDLVETETGWQFDDDDADLRAFDGNATTTATPAPAAKSGTVALADGDFESITGVNITTLADATSVAIPNWTPGGAGVQILMSATYGIPSYSKAKSVFCIHLNNPASAANGTQGSLSTTLAVAPAKGKAFTVHYDVCRSPDGPYNVWPAIKISTVLASVTHEFQVHSVPYNGTDSVGHSTWQRQSFVYTGTGAATVIKFESLMEKFGPIIDNVEILSGKHPLAAAPLGKVAGLCQRALPLVTVVALASFHIF